MACVGGVDYIDAQSCPESCLPSNWPPDCRSPAMLRLASNFRVHLLETLFLSTLVACAPTPDSLAGVPIARGGARPKAPASAGNGR